MGRISIDVDCKCCCISTKTCRSKTNLIDFLKQFFFECFYVRKFRMNTDFSCQCFFCKNCCFLKCSTNSNTNNNRRTSVRTCFFYSTDNCFFYSFNSICWF